MNKHSKFSLAALVLSAFIMLIALLTAFIATPSFLNRLHTTILLWQLPLVTIGLIVVAAMTETESGLAKIFRLIAVGTLTLGFIFTNVTKNTVQDTVSNISNYVDVAKATIEHEAENIEEYGRSIEHAINRAERDMRDKYEDDWDEEEW
jgi:hypothetical protein